MNKARCVCSRCNVLFCNIAHIDVDNRFVCGVRRRWFDVEGYLFVSCQFYFRTNHPIAEYVWCCRGRSSREVQSSRSVVKIRSCCCTIEVIVFITSVDVIPTSRCYSVGYCSVGYKESSFKSFFQRQLCRDTRGITQQCVWGKRSIWATDRCYSELVSCCSKHIRQIKRTFSFNNCPLFTCQCFVFQDVWCIVFAFSVNIDCCTYSFAFVHCPFNIQTVDRVTSKCRDI